MTLNHCLVETAIPLSSEESDLQEPLLRFVDLEQTLVPTTTVSNPQPQDAPIKDDTVLLDDAIVQHVFRYFQMLGWTMGFLLQCVSLGGTAIMALNWDQLPTSEETITSHILYWVLFGVANSWLLLFPLVCWAIERSWRVSGIQFIQTYLLEMEEPIISTQTRRMTFVASVCFLAGVVMGCFMAWGLVDLFLDASLAMLATLVISLVVCLLLCKGMIVIYDSFST